MDYNEIMHYASMLFAVLAALVFVVNIIVEVIKAAYSDLPTSYLTIVVSILVTVLALLIAVAVMDIPMMWYYIVGAVFTGIFVSYAAMFGFDKFKDAWDKLQKYKNME